MCCVAMVKCLGGVHRYYLKNFEVKHFKITYKKLKNCYIDFLKLYLFIFNYSCNALVLDERLQICINILILLTIVNVNICILNKIVTYYICI